MAEDWMGKFVEGIMSSRSPQAKIAGDAIASELTRSFAEAVEDLTAIGADIASRTSEDKVDGLSDEAVAFYNAQLKNIENLSTNLIKRSKPRR
jgi:hypothetical protein